MHLSDKFLLQIALIVIYMGKLVIILSMILAVIRHLLPNLQIMRFK